MATMKAAVLFSAAERGKVGIGGAVAVSLEQIAAACDLIANRRDGVVKVAIRP